MTRLLLSSLLACLLLAAPGCRDDRDDDTGQSERQDRLDTVQGKAPDSK